MISIRIAITPTDRYAVVDGSTTRDARLVAEGLHEIELWLRREAFGGDEVAITQIEEELGHQVKMRGRP